jgi:hypothetical protein
MLWMIRNTLADIFRGKCWSDETHFERSVFKQFRTFNEEGKK